MKKKIMIGCFLLGTCMLCACGNKGTEEHIKTGEEIAIEQASEANDAVEKNNEAALKMIQDANEADQAETE